MARKSKRRPSPRAAAARRAADPTATRPSRPSWRCWPSIRSSRSAWPQIASDAGLSLADLRAEFASTLAILAAHIKEIDRAGAGRQDADMAEESPRERLFDVLMRRLEILAPHKEAVRSLLRSAARNPGLALALNGLAVRSQQWMLTAADIGASGPKGMLRAQGLALLFANVLRTWVDDDDDGPCPHARRARPRAGARPALRRPARRAVPLPERACARDAGRVAPHRPAAAASARAA